MDREKIINIIIAIGVFVLIIIILIVAINSMEERLMEDCKKQNYIGIKSYWDLDINCAEIYNIQKITTVNETTGGSQ